MSSKSDDVFIANLLRSAKDVIMLVTAASDYNASSRTPFYFAAYITSASMVEAILYHMISKYVTKNPEAANEYRKNKRWKELQQIKPPAADLKDDIWIAKRTYEPFDINQARFQQLIIFARDKKLISKVMCENLEKIMKERNKIHIQKLSSTKRSYTMSMIMDLDSVAIQLFTQYMKNN